ncbi:MAG: hypothetical protein J6I49_03020 [Bacteroidales bacterium]|nr:hypothetical protein [Bacteroidales bacterium]
MDVRRRYILLTLCMLLVCRGWAQEVRKASLEVRNASAGRMQVDFRLGDLRLDTAAARFARIHAEGMTTDNGIPGSPALPTLCRLVELPKGSRLKVLEVSGEELPWWPQPALDRPLIPILPPHSKSGTCPEYSPDKALYDSDVWYRSGAPLEAEHLGTMGEREVYRLTVRPMAYNPVCHGLRVYRSLSAMLETVAPQAVTLNPPVPERFLIVSRPQYREGLADFVRWKRQEGFEVLEVYAETHRRDSIKALIHPLFSEASLLEPAPTYMLIVGDVADIQSFVGTTQFAEMDGHITDLPYAEHTGDMLPDALLGRWPVNDTAELRTVVEKTLRYEQAQALDTAALRRVMLVAGQESASVAPVTTNGQVNYIKGEVLLQHPGADTLCFYNPTSRQQSHTIMDEIGQGIGWLNYTAHCTAGGWTSPSVSSGSFDTLPAHQPAFYVNNCCKSNDFGGTCFGEQLLRMPDGGAIGIIGATNETLWIEDYYWAVGPKTPPVLNPVYDEQQEGAFDQWAGRHPVVQTQGEVLLAGNLAVTAFGSAYSSFYWEIYCLLGDPSLRPYLEVPQRASVGAVAMPGNGDTEVEVAGTPGARVSVVQGGALLGTALLDSAGMAVISLNSPLDTLPILLTASGQGLIPAVDTLAIDTGRALGVALRHVAVSDTLLACTVENTGQQRLDGLRIVLEQTREDSLVGAVLARQVAVVDSLLPGGSRRIELPVSVVSLGQIPLLQARLQAWGDSLLGSLLVRHDLQSPYPVLTLRLLTADGAEARRLMPGRPYLLSADIEGSYDSIRLEVASSPGTITEVSASDRLAFTAPDSLCLLRIGADIYLNHWQERKEYWLLPGLRTEGFEAGTVRLPWDMACRVPWTLDSTESHSGRYSLRSGNIGHDQTSDISLHVLLSHDDTISFWAKLSTEPQHDMVVFSVDGIRRTPVLFGHAGWRRFTYPLPAGRHTLRWRYLKDNSISEGSDCVWIDDIQMPMAYWEVEVSGECENGTLSVPAPPEGLSRLLVYPNPASREAHLRASEPMTIQVLDAVGRQVDTFRIGTEEPFVWHIPQLAEGIYMLAGHGESGTAYQRLIITNHP